MRSFETEATCSNCKNTFYWWETGLNVPGGKDREEVRCPYCDELSFSRITSGVFCTRKKED
uniref:hypothetical protein n=1 Tax=Lactococcus garvieae TaxID=1363 RepID=UPI00359C4425